MVQFAQGNMFDVMNDYDVLLVTGNGVVRDGNLVMGKGAAKDLAQRYRFFPALVGSKLQQYYPHIYSVDGRYYEKVYRYYLFLWKSYGENRTILGLLQTKMHYIDPTPLLLLSRSCDKLKTYAEMFPHQKIACSYPAIGYGGLPKDSVVPYIDKLPDNVTLFEL